MQNFAPPTSTGRHNFLLKVINSKALIKCTKLINILPQNIQHTTQPQIDKEVM